MLYFKLIRIYSLPLSFSPIFMGVSFAFYSQAQFSLLQVFLLFFTAFGLQIISNIANDYGDAVRKVDGKNRIGFERLYAKKKISKKKILFLLFLSFVITFLMGVFLLWISWQDIFLFFWLLLGIVCLLAALKYSLGKNPHSQSGWGDLSVFIFFGLIAVLGSYSILTKKIPPTILILESIAIGLLITSVLNLNNIRDLETDKKAKRKTVAIRLGDQNAKIYQKILVLTSFIFFLVVKILSIESSWEYSVFLFFLPILNITFSLDVVKQKYNSYLKKQCFFILLFSIFYNLKL